MVDVKVPEVVRRVVGRVGVDAGQVAVASSGVRAELSFGPSDVEVGSGYAVANSGYGDGVYDVMELRSADPDHSNDPDHSHDPADPDRVADVVGVEVVFIAADVEDVVSEMAVAAHPDVPRPTSEVSRAAYFDGDGDALAVCRRFDEVWSEVADEVWDRLLGDACPSGVPEVVGSLPVDSTVGVGDPCHGVPALAVPVPSGVYDVVVWRTDDTPSARVARLALYRRPGE